MWKSAWVQWLVILVLGFAGAASGASAQQADSPDMLDTTAYSKDPPYVIGVSNVSVANTFRVQMIEELRRAALSNPEISQVIITDAGGSASKQISDIEDLIIQEVDALLVAPASATAIAPVVEQAHMAGIPVIVFNSDLDSDGVVVRVLPPYHEWAKQSARWLVEAMGGEGNVIALRGIAGLAAEVDEWAGAQIVFDEHPQIRIIATEYGDWAYDKAKTAMANILANNPRVDGVASLGDDMTWAAAEVLSARGYDVSQIPMIGIGGSNGFLKYWQREGLDAYVIADPTSIGVAALDAALDVLHGRPVAALQAPDTIVIDNSNLGDFVKPDLPDSVWVGTELSDEELVELLRR